MLCYNLEKSRKISVHFQGKLFNTIQVYAPATDAEEAEVDQFYTDLEDLLELTPKKDVKFIMGDWNSRGKSRDTWSNRQVWPWCAKQRQSLTILPRVYTGHSNTLFQQHKVTTLHMDITKCQNQIQAAVDPVLQ